MGQADSSSLHDDIHGSFKIMTALEQTSAKKQFGINCMVVLQCPVAGHCLPGSSSIEGPAARATPWSCSSCPSCSCHGKSPHSTAQRSSEQASPVSVGDLDSYKKQAFVLKEGVEYRIKISFRVRIPIWKWNTRLLRSWLGQQVGLC